MARTMFDMGFHPATLMAARPMVGISIKDIESKAAKYISPSAPETAAQPASAPQAPQDTILGVPPHVAALGGLGILGTLAALIFGHK